MAEPFLGEIRMMSFGFAPKGWAACNGQLLPISQNQALFSLLGTTYAGDGRTTFGLPDLRGRIPLHAGTGFVQGQAGGEETHTLSAAEMPSHTHAATASASAAAQTSPATTVWATGTDTAYSAAWNATLNPACISVTGGSQPHENRAPFLTINFCIALQGIFPSRN